MISEELIKAKRKYKVSPTKRQLTALQLINKGMKPTKAMRAAGYSESAARNPKQALLDSTALSALVDDLKLELENAGLTKAYIAQKIYRLTNANKEDEDDYKIQLGALQLATKIHQEAKKPQEGQISRKIELTEYILGDKSPEAL